ncbi:hypothetical protein [Spiroplasma turonicum]|uniref:Lipoprotein n=1 Tax=Spiroplasma turonicum TaxID=216946 RepID=A0A0K1P6C6_9MOLU|nr:hypothetical protein [Spiroplasma turonicum]AKU79749.1 hypothetical protein STURON_00503 [Spiroplasma turonicum]
MNKFKKITLSIMMLAIPSSVLSCSTNTINPDFENANYLVAYSNIFNSTKNGFYNLLPDLKLKNQKNKNAKKFLFKDNNIVLNCIEFKCDDNKFEGTKLTNENYANPNLINEKSDLISNVQIAFDSIAYSYGIGPLSKDNIFYDFSDLNLTVDYNNTFYKFIRDEDNNNIIKFYTTQSTIISNKDSSEQQNNYSILNENVDFDLDIIKSFLPVYFKTDETVPIDYNLEVKEIQSESKEDSDDNETKYYLNLSFEFDEKKLENEPIIDNLANILTNILFYIEPIKFVDKTHEILIESNESNTGDEPNVGEKLIDVLNSEPEEEIDYSKLEYFRNKTWKTSTFSNPINIKDKNISYIEIKTKYHNLPPKEEIE